MQYDEELYRELDAAFPPREHTVRPSDLDRLAEAHQRAGEAMERALEAAKRAVIYHGTDTRIAINGEEVYPTLPVEWHDLRERIAAQRAARVESQYQELRRQMELDRRAVAGAAASGLPVEEVRRRLVEADEIRSIGVPTGSITADQIDYRGGLTGWSFRTPGADRFAAPPPPHEASPGEKHLAEQLEAAGWHDVEVIPPGQHQYSNEDGTPIAGAVEVAGFDGPDRDWRIYADGSSDGRIEGYWVSRLDDDEETERLPAHQVPTPAEAVGAWETHKRAIWEAARPRGKKG